jgi:hypothetical protein
MSSTNPEDNLTPTERDDLDRLEAAAQHALAEIRDRHLYRDSHSSFEAYVGERWAANVRAAPTAGPEPAGGLPSTPCEALARACEQTLSALAREDRDPLPTLRWLLTEANGMVGEVAHQLEVRAPDIDDEARAQFRADVLALDDELTTVKALLVGPTDWDSELGRLLDGELPPFDSDPDE